MPQCAGEEPVFETGKGASTPYRRSGRGSSGPDSDPTVGAAKRGLGKPGLPQLRTATIAT